MRTFSFSSFPFNVNFAPDTGAGGGTAVANSPAGSATTGAAPGDTTTPNAPAGEKPKAKRGRAAAGTSVFATDGAGVLLTEESCKAFAKEKGGKFTAFRVKSPAALGKADRFFVSNHRNAVQHSVMTTDGYNVAGILGGSGKPADPEKVKARASKAIDALSDEDRRALLAQYMGTPAAASADVAGKVPSGNATADAGKSAATPVAKGATTAKGSKGK